MKTNKKNPDKPQESIAAEELKDDVLDEASGAGNPFDAFPRVPTKPIDDDLIGNG